MVCTSHIGASPLVVVALLVIADFVHAAASGLVVGHGRRLRGLHGEVFVLVRGLAWRSQSDCHALDTKLASLHLLDVAPGPFINLSMNLECCSLPSPWPRLPMGNAGDLRARAKFGRLSARRGLPATSWRENCRQIEASYSLLTLESTTFRDTYRLHQHCVPPIGQGECCPRPRSAATPTPPRRTFRGFLISWAGHVGREGDSGV